MYQHVLHFVQSWQVDVGHHALLTTHIGATDIQVFDRMITFQTSRPLGPLSKRILKSATSTSHPLFNRDPQTLRKARTIIPAQVLLPLAVLLVLMSFAVAHGHATWDVVLLIHVLVGVVAAYTHDIICAFKYGKIR